MSYYLRRIVKGNWENYNTEADLPGEAITVDWNCKNNEWSVFKCSSCSKKNDETNFIVLRMVGDNTKATCDGVDLLFLDESFIEKAGMKIIPDDKEHINTLHCNLREVNYSLIQKMVTYTLNKIKQSYVLSYTPIEIKELFINADKSYLEKYEQYYPKEKIKNIYRAFLNDLPSDSIFKTLK